MKTQKKPTQVQKQMNNTAKAFYSPFPREKSNAEVLRRSYAKKIDERNTIIDIPPTVTMSYMKKNPFYFDLRKSCKVHKKNRPQTTKSQRQPGYTIYDNNKLERLLRSGKENFIAPRPKLDPGCELIQPKLRNNGLTLEDREKLTQKDILNIIHKIKIPMEEEADQMGKVPK